MKEFKGTPGPWLVTEIDDDDLSEQSSTMIAAGDTVIACVGPSVHTLLGIDKNNAHLIAAAPELLEALQLLMAEQTGGNKSCGHNGFTCMCPYDKARAAIAKALGESK